MSRGFILLEVAVAYVILTLAIVALVPVFIMGLKANKTTEKVQTAAFLSSELLEEIRLRKWDEFTPTSRAYTTSYSTPLGPEAGESATDKTAFDDVDDFNGWTEATVKNPLNQAVSGLASFSRSVTVQYVDSSFNLSALPTDFKKVTVCTSVPNRTPVCLATLVTNH